MVGALVSLLHNAALMLAAGFVHAFRERDVAWVPFAELLASAGFVLPKRISFVQDGGAVGSSGFGRAFRRGAIAGW